MARADNAQRITDMFIAELERIQAGGPAERHECPWHKVASGVRNGASGRPYNGVNVLLLWIRMGNSGWVDPRFYTFNQVSKGGLGCVRKGSKGTTVCFWKPIKRTKKAADGTDKDETFLMLKTYTVFNHSQIEWKEGKEPAADMASCATDPDHVMAIDALLNAGPDDGPTVLAASQAAYAPGADHVLMPSSCTFKTSGGYVATLAHEVAHWTGHPTRCDRADGMAGRFGDEAYAFEELVAEFASAFFCAEYGVESEGLRSNHLAYLAGWIKVLKNDRHAIFTAARMARKAMAYIDGECDAA